MAVKIANIWLKPLDLSGPIDSELEKTRPKIQNQSSLPQNITKKYIVCSNILENQYIIPKWCGSRMEEFSRLCFETNILWRQMQDLDVKMTLLLNDCWQKWQKLH